MNSTSAQLQAKTLLMTDSAPNTYLWVRRHVWLARHGSNIHPSVKAEVSSTEIDWSFAE